jgi:hypothetical protein
MYLFNIIYLFIVRRVDHLNVPVLLWLVFFMFNHKVNNLPDMVMHAYNPNTQEAETEES